MAARRTGSIDALEEVQLERREPGPGELRVRVHASAVNPADIKVLRGELAGRFLHARVEPLVPGYDLSGVVEAAGEGADGIAVGDAVFGHLPYAPSNRQGAFAETVVVPVTEVAVKPQPIGHDTAAACATVGLTALQALRDRGRLEAGQRAMVLGASGGVGSLAVGIARRLGAHVTAVCSAHAVDFVTGLGADEVIDRQARDPMAVDGGFDVVFDAAGRYSYAQCRHLLRRGGAMVTTMPSPGLVLGKLMSAASSRRATFVMVRSRRADLETLAGWIEGGLAVPIDSRYPLREASQALARLERGGMKGRVVVDVIGGLS